MIGIIVDHPSRDLPSLCILASEFLKKKKNIALIPSYKIEQALLENSSKFSLIIFNFFRLENYKTILYAKSKNIGVAILDQESVAGFDGLGLKNVFKNNILNKNLKFIDHYFFPSKLIKRECLKFAPNKPTNCVVAGYQRLDIVKKKNSNVKQKNFILICTNLPISNPGFTTKKIIIRDGVKYGPTNTTKELEQKRYAQNRIALDIFYLEISKIVNHFKDINFVIRPHPFENINFWKSLEKFKNCKVTNQLNSFEWILKCKGLIHLDCTTSIEASLTNKPAISLAYAKYHLKNNFFKLAHDCSYLCRSFEEAKNKIQLINQNKLKAKKPLNINKFFFSPKKLSSEIIANNILSNTNSIKLSKNINFSLLTYIKFFLEKYFGNKIYNFFLLLYRGRYITKQRKGKIFSPHLIKSYINLKVKIKKKNFFYIIKNSKN